MIYFSKINKNSLLFDEIITKTALSYNLYVHIMLEALQVSGAPLLTHVYQFNESYHESVIKGKSRVVSELAVLAVNAMVTW